MERTARSHRQQPATNHDMDQRREWQETEIRYSNEGGIALQVHGGGDYTKQLVRYRNIQVKELKGG